VILKTRGIAEIGIQSGAGTAEELACANAQHYQSIRSSRMISANRAPLFSLLAALTLCCPALPSRAQGNAVDKFNAKGYDHSVTFGSTYIPGLWNAPFGSLEVTQTSGRSGNTTATGIVGFVDAVAFPSPTTAVEVFGVADAAGAVTPTSPSFSTAGKVDVAMEGIALYYELDPFTLNLNLVGAEPGTIHIASTLANPTSIDNVHERSTYMLRDGLVNHSLSVKSDLHGRFGYGGTGTVSIWFEGSANTAIAPPGTSVIPDESRFGFVQSGTMSAQK
jgi:hypothetical protein